MREPRSSQTDIQEHFGKRRRDHDHERRERLDPQDPHPVPGPKQRDDTAFPEPKSGASGNPRD